MQVILAGYNVDAELLEAVKRGEEINPDSLTPETITAAYARISRSPAPVNELRSIARQKVEEARKSNERIVYGMGHHSVADHAIFDFDILSVSRLMVESIEERRLAGYTEKSQRYVTFEGDYVRPEEFSSQDLERFKRLVERQNDYYQRANQKLFGYLKEKNKKRIRGLGEKERAIFLRNLENSAKEDARYILSLATETQLGCSYTGQTLELAIRRNKYGKLAEQREFARLLYEAVVKVAPSLIQLTDAELFREHQGKELKEDYFKYTQSHLEELVKEIFSKADSEVYENCACSCFEQEENVILVNSFNIDLNILAALLHKNSQRPIKDCYALANYLIQTKQAEDFIIEGLKYLSEFDKLPREFEVTGLIYEIVLSTSCFAQLKRHRMNTLLAQDYDPQLGYTIPSSIQGIGWDKEFLEICRESDSLFYEFEPKYGKAAEYCLTNAHRRRVLFAANLRQLCHISRIRLDQSAQWEIRDVVGKMCYLAKEVAPLSTLFLAGKDKFGEIREKIYGKAD